MTEQAFRPALRSQADVECFWTTICRPLGWRTPELWVVLVDAEGVPFPSVHQVAELPTTPDEVAIDHLLGNCRSLLEEFDPGGRVALLRCRPGTARANSADLAWARALCAAARRWGVELEVIHVAGDDGIRPLPLGGSTLLATPA